MKIVLLTRCLDYGGAERQLVLLAGGLRDRGHQLEVAVFYAGGPLQEELRRRAARAGVAEFDISHPEQLTQRIVDRVVERVEEQACVA